MKTPCYTDNVNKYPNSTSCPMILRSACSHGQAQKSVMKTKCSHHGRESLIKADDDRITVCDSPKSSILIHSLLETSIKQLTLKSTKTFSALKENLCNRFEQYSRIPSIEKDKNVECFTSQVPCKTPTSLSTFYVSQVSDNEKEFIEDAINLKSASSSVMSRTRSQISLRRLSSGSEEESSHPENRVNSQRNQASSIFSHRSSSLLRRSVHTPSSTNTPPSSNHANSSTNFPATNWGNTGNAASSSSFSHSTPYGQSVLKQNSVSPESPLMNLSNVQASVCDRFRWLIWKSVYLKIVKSINFDVWLLSWLRRNYRTFLLLIILLPFLLYLLFGAKSIDTAIIANIYDLLSSSIDSTMSYIYSLVDTSPEPIESLKSEATHESCSGVFSIAPFSAIWTFLSNFWLKTEDSKSFTSAVPTSTPLEYSESQAQTLNREEFKSLALEVFEEKLNDLKAESQSTHNKNTKDEAALLHKELSDLHRQFQSFSDVISRLEKDVHRMENSRSTSSKDMERFSAEHKSSILILNTKVKEFEEKLNFLGSLKSWKPEWKSEFITLIEEHIVTALRSVMTSDKSSPYYFFNEHLNSGIVHREELSAEIRAAVDNLKKEISSDITLNSQNIKLIEDIVQRYLKSHQIVSSGSISIESVSDSRVKQIVKEAIMLYDADKIGKVDYALESGGGSVLGTRCSESYLEKSGKFSLFQFPFWSDQNSPRTAIQPTPLLPGKCWAFKGSQGFLVIELSYTIMPTGFTLEHIPLSISPTGMIDSAPREFSVWGLANETDSEGTVLGVYTYDKNGGSLQHFPVQYIKPGPFSYVELKIHSNHGNLEYTCLYRFRVHGTRV